MPNRPVTVAISAYFRRIPCWKLRWYRTKPKSMEFDKHQLVFIRRDLDMTKTGGPLIPKNSLATVLVRRRDGRLWVNVHNFGRRHLMPEDVSGFSVN